MGLLSGRAGRLTAQNGGFRPGQCLTTHLGTRPVYTASRVGVVAEDDDQAAQQTDPVSPPLAVVVETA